MERRARDGGLVTSTLALSVILLVAVNAACSLSRNNPPPVLKESDDGTRSPQSVGSVSECGDAGPVDLSATQPETRRVARDPLLGDSAVVDCGPPRDDPNGYEWGVISADGSCQSCETPPLVLAPCNSAVRAKDVTRTVLRASIGKRIRLFGVVDFAEVFCTKMGGQCACNNRCGAPLRLRHRGIPIVPLPSKQERINQRNAILNGIGTSVNDTQEQAKSELNASFAFLALARVGKDTPLIRQLREYASDDGVLACRGDDNSVCCPFALDRETQKVRVIAGGLLVAGAPQWQQDSPVEYRLLVEDICRVAD